MNDESKYASGPEAESFREPHEMKIALTMPQVKVRPMPAMSEDEIYLRLAVQKTRYNFVRTEVQSGPSILAQKAATRVTKHYSLSAIKPGFLQLGCLGVQPIVDGISVARECHRIVEMAAGEKLLRRIMGNPQSRVRVGARSK